MKIGAVVSEFNYDITMMMLERAKEHAQFLDCKITQTVKVPGVFDMGLAIKKLLERDDIVIQHASRKISDLAVDYGKPVGLGITGPGMTRLQAEARIERAKAAVEAVVKLHRRLRL